MERGLSLLFTIYDTLEPSFLAVMLRIITLLFTVEQWVHRNRHKTPVDNDQYHQAKIVEGPVARSYGRTPMQDRPVPQVARDGATVLTQVCNKCPEVLGILVSNKVEIEEVDRSRCPCVHELYTYLINRQAF